MNVYDKIKMYCEKNKIKYKEIFEDHWKLLGIEFCIDGWIWVSLDFKENSRTVITERYENVECQGPSDDLDDVVYETIENRINLKRALELLK